MPSLLREGNAPNFCALYLLNRRSSEHSASKHDVNINRGMPGVLSSAPPPTQATDHGHLHKTPSHTRQDTGRTLRGLSRGSGACLRVQGWQRSKPSFEADARERRGFSRVCRRRLLYLSFLPSFTCSTHIVLVSLHTAQQGLGHATSCFPLLVLT